MPLRTMPSTHAQAMWPGDSVFDMSAVVPLVRPVLKADRTDTEAPARPWWPSVGWPGAPVKFHPAFFAACIKSVKSVPAAWCSVLRSAATGTLSCGQSGPVRRPCLQWSRAMCNCGVPVEFKSPMSEKPVCALVGFSVPPASWGTRALHTEFTRGGARG